MGVAPVCLVCVFEPLGLDDPLTCAVFCAPFRDQYLYHKVLIAEVVRLSLVAAVSKQSCLVIVPLWTRSNSECVYVRFASE
jgi:hypothetical protein